jgi:predicted TPR repeat methyltransferase
MDAIEAHEQDTSQYDRQALEWGWNPEVFFGLMWADALPGNRLLDIGIGTGLCAEPFFNAGVEISGFDGSEKMLRSCRDKHISHDLKKHLFEDVPWPYRDACFDLVIAGGVLHFLGNLELVFKEVQRVLKPEGVFGFTTAMLDKGHLKNGAWPADEAYSRVLDAASGVHIYKHSETYILRLLGTLGLAVQKKLVFLASRNPQTGAEHYNTLFVAR